MPDCYYQADLGRTVADLEPLRPAIVDPFRMLGQGEAFA